MFCYLIMLTFLLCTSNGTKHASNTTICVARGNDRGENECHQYPVIFELSNLSTMNEMNCTNVQIYLTREIMHTLDGDLVFEDSVKYTGIHGSSNGQPTIIQCLNHSGIRFGENSKNEVCLSNIVFISCQHHVPLLKISTALYFNRTSYSLQNITVKNTNGSGVAVRNSKKQFISNCNNTDVHVRIVLENELGEARITIAGTKFLSR